MPKVCCFEFEQVNWIQEFPPILKFPLSVNVWRIRITQNLALLQYFESILNNLEQQRALSYYFEKDKIRFIISRVALRLILSKYSNILPSAIQFEFGANKKPFFLQTSLFKINYNVSHSGDWILIAVSDHEIGIDIEKTDTEYQYKEILPDYFRKEEVDFITMHKNPNEAFFLLWTRKEALIKATGKGIENNLRYIPCLNGLHQIETSKFHEKQNWNIKSFDVEQHYIASIAFNIDIKEIFFWESNLLV